MNTDPDEYLYEQNEEILSDISAIVKHRVWPKLPTGLRREDPNMQFQIDVTTGIGRTARSRLRWASPEQVGG
jgi:hypothetical protein